MFDNKNFYPTPNYLIDKMLTGVDLRKINTILEPSAGKGDIVDFIVQRTKTSYYLLAKDIDCIEIDKDLQATLKGKNYRVVHNDFLHYNTYKHYDLIVMNPPFDNGEKHLLKALQLQKNGGGIICLLNAETLKNPYSNERKDLITQLNKYNASIEYITDAFVYAERKTDVEIALVKVEIPQQELTCKFLEELKNEETYEEIFDRTSTELTRFTEENNFIENAVEQYTTEIKLAIKFVNEYMALKPYIKDSLDKDDKYATPILTLTIYGEDKTLSINNLVKKIRYKYWKALFSNPKFTKNLTTNLIDNLNKQLNELQNYDFSVYNIMTIQQELMQKTITGIEQTILKLFDEFSAQYSYFDEGSNNIHYYNGWKTNKAWKINSKVILPHNAFSTWDKSLELNYHKTIDKFEDMIKVFNFLATKDKQDINVRNILDDNQNCGNTKDIDFKYFTATFYKKGTVHITFTKTDLLDKFNLFGSQKKGWLPPNFMKQKYEDLNSEEKNIVDDFCGEEKYNNFLENKDYYLQSATQMLALTQN